MFLLTSNSEKFIETNLRWILMKKLKNKNSYKSHSVVVQFFGFAIKLGRIGRRRVLLIRGGGELFRRFNLDEQFFE